MNKKKLKIEAINDKCSNCGAEIKYDALSQQLKCDNCNQIHNFDKSKDIEIHDINKISKNQEHREWLDNNRSFQCSNCGAGIVLEKSNFSKICPYCGSHFVSDEANLPGAKPDAILPFAFNEKMANEQFIAKVKRKFFVPKNFKKNLPTNKIRGVYIPAFSISGDSTSTYNGWLERGSGDDTTSFHIEGSTNCTHKDILVEASSHLSDYDLKKISPYNLENAYKYDNNFIKGYSVEHYHEVMDHIINLAHNKMEKEIKDDILGRYRYNKVKNLDIDAKYSNEKFSYYLLPLYNLEYEYKGKKYIAHMNGQTGKIGGDLPMSGWKIALLVMLLLIPFLFVFMCILITVIGF